MLSVTSISHDSTAVTRNNTVVSLCEANPPGLSQFELLTFSEVIQDRSNIIMVPLTEAYDHDIRDKSR